MSRVTTLPRGQAFTAHDLDSMPDDGHRYELLDGSLIVTPAPSPRHQMVVAELHVRLRAACPPDLRVLFAPLDVRLGENTVLQPDLVVAAKRAFTERDLPVAPSLAVEVLSPSTRHIDLELKRARYEAAGCPSYWVVDPDVPSLTAWELQEGQYVEIASVRDDETFHATAPYAVDITPRALLD